MKYKHQHRIISILLTWRNRNDFKLQMYLRSWEKVKSTSVTQKPMPSQREQYGNTVHLFIDAGRSPRKITSVSITFYNNLWKSVEVYIVFSSLSRFSFLLPRRSSPAHSFGCAPSFVEPGNQPVLRLVQASSWPYFMFAIPSPKVPIHIIHLENIVKSCFWGPSEDEGPQQWWYQTNNLGVSTQNTLQL
jgi:hypothetical protein